MVDHEQIVFAEYIHGRRKVAYDRDAVYIGDARQASSPQLGQGANMAILDASSLAFALRSHDIGDALRANARARRWHQLFYQMASFAFTPMYQSDSDALVVLRDKILTPLSKLPPSRTILERLVLGNIVPPIRGQTREIWRAIERVS